MTNIPRGKRHVDDDFDSRRRGPVPARHGDHDRRPQRAGGLLASHRARQGRGNAAVRGVLGRHRRAARAIIERDDHDDDRSGQRRSSDLSSGTRPRLWRERRHHRNGLARRSHWRPRVLVVLCPADDLRRSAGQAPGSWPPRGGGRLARRFRTRSLRPHHTPTGHGRSRRTVASLGFARCSRRARRRLPPGTGRPAFAGRRRAGHDRGDAVFDGRDCGHAFRLLRWRGRTRAGLRADHRAEHRNRDQLRHGGDRREHDGEAAGGRLHPVQADRRAHRSRPIPVHDPASCAGRKRDRRRHASRRVPHRLQRRGRRRSDAGDRLVHTPCRAPSAGAGLASDTRLGSRRARQSGRGRRGGPPHRRAFHRGAVRIDGFRSPRGKPWQDRAHRVGGRRRASAGARIPVGRERAAGFGSGGVSADQDPARARPCVSLRRHRSGGSQFDSGEGHRAGRPRV